MRCSATAIARGEPSCTTRSTEPMSMPSSSEAVATTARSSPRAQPALDVEAHLAREAAVMRHHEAFAETLVEREGDALAHAPRADEDQRRAMRADLLGDAIVDLGPHLLARDRSQLVGRHFDRQRPSRAGARRRRSSRVGLKKLRDRLDRADRRREADPLRLASRPRARRARPAARASARDASRACRRPSRGSRRRSRCVTPAKSRARLLGGEQNVERLGRRDQHVRRLAQHLLALRRRSCRRSGRPCESARAACRARAASVTSAASGFSRFLRTSLVSALSGET